MEFKTTELKTTELKTTELKAYAKLNLGLAVTAKREDGFHELDTVFVRIDIHDVIRLEPQSKTISLKITGADLPTDSKNLCYRAAELYLSKAGLQSGIAIHLDKHIPIAAGLGGGSSDAAAVLRGLAKAFPADVDVLALAAELGSDVPFFVHDVSAAHAQGRGEKLEPLTLPELHLVLVNPGIHVSAGEAYKALETLTPPLNLNALQGSLDKEPSYFNALQPGVLKAYPEIDAVLVALSGAGLRGALMSGSGSTCFALAQTEEEATASVASLTSQYPNWWVRAAKPL